MSWDAFLEEKAEDVRLSEYEKNAFCTRFAEPNLRKSEDDVANQKLFISKPELKRRLRRVYNAFAPHCPALNTSNKGKFQILRDYLKQEYSHYKKTEKLPGLAATSNLGGVESAIATPTQQEEMTGDFYVKRPHLESRCYTTLLQPGSLLRLKALRQMGKTSLITRVLAQMKNEGYRTVNLSFKLADTTLHFANLDKFLRWFCTNVSRELKLPSQVEDYWEEEDAGSKVNCTTYFEEYLLPEADSPLVLCLDDADLVFPHRAIYEDFFALLRLWHERANSRPSWKKLRLVVVYSTEAFIPLNINQSPFNVGVPIELPEFRPEEVLNLAKQHGLDWNAAQVQQLMKLVGGHPALLQQAFSYLKSCQDITIEQFLAIAPTEAGIYGNHLRQHLSELREELELAVAFKKVVTAPSIVQLDPIQTYKLHRLGLVQLQGNQVKPRCNLYSLYFRDRLGDA